MNFQHMNFQHMNGMIITSCIWMLSAYFQHMNAASITSTIWMQSAYFQLAYECCQYNFQHTNCEHKHECWQHYFQHKNDVSITSIIWRLSLSWERVAGPDCITRKTNSLQLLIRWTTQLIKSRRTSGLWEGNKTANGLLASITSEKRDEHRFSMAATVLSDQL